MPSPAWLRHAQEACRAKGVMVARDFPPFEKTHCRLSFGTMDEMKKEIVYNLGLVYERMGDVEKALACMKQIYEVDYGYRDVAQRVESSYDRNISGS